MDTATNTVTATHPTGAGPGAVAITPVDAVPEEADLGVQLGATPVPNLVNGRIDYTLTLTNNGPDALAAGTVEAPLPAPMTATSPDCTVAAGKVTCTTGPLAPGASVTRHFTAPVAALSLGTTYTVTATRTTSSPTDPNPANDTATRKCTALTSLIINCT